MEFSIVMQRFIVLRLWQLLLIAHRMEADELRSARLRAEPIVVKFVPHGQD